MDCHEVARNGVADQQPVGVEAHSLRLVEAGEHLEHGPVQVADHHPIVARVRNRDPFPAVRGDLAGEGQGVRISSEDGPECRSEREVAPALEELCDEHNEALPELKSFILPGGSEASARLHVARTLCRQSELAAREADGMHGINPLVPVYLNRLSDLLFILARAANALARVDEPLWHPGGRSNQPR